MCRQFTHFRKIFRQEGLKFCGAVDVIVGLTCYFLPHVMCLGYYTRHKAGKVVACQHVHSQHLTCHGDCVCVSEGYCDPLNNYNIYSYMDFLNSSRELDNNSVIIIGARVSLLVLYSLSTCLLHLILFRIVTHSFSNKG